MMAGFGHQPDVTKRCTGGVSTFTGNCDTWNSNGKGRLLWIWWHLPAGWDPRRNRKLEEVGESWGRLGEVEGSWEKLKKVGGSWRRLGKLGEVGGSWRKLGEVEGSWGKPSFLSNSIPLMWDFSFFSLSIQISAADFSFQHCPGTVEQFSSLIVYWVGFLLLQGAGR